MRNWELGVIYNLIMKIGIIVAMDKEMNLLLPHVADVSTVTANGFEFHTGLMAGHKVVVCKCGIGKVNAAVGALTPPAQVLDLVLASEVAYHDVWCGPGTVRGQAAGYPERFQCPLSADARAALGAREGLLASGDIFVDDPADLRRILELYPDAVAVDMESAAIAQVCALKCVPFVCLRVVSDTPGAEGNAAAYSDFWTAAPERTFASVEKLLGLIPA